MMIFERDPMWIQCYSMKDKNPKHCSHFDYGHQCELPLIRMMHVSFVFHHLWILKIKGNNMKQVIL
jgi:hypothetical protein